MFGRVVSLVGSNLRVGGLNENKKLKTVTFDDSNGNGIVNSFSQIIPSFLNIFRDKRRIAEIKIDDQRNLLYVLSNIVREENSAEGNTLEKSLVLGLA
jgi:hypothetical protein